MEGNLFHLQSNPKRKKSLVNRIDASHDAAKMFFYVFVIYLSNVLSSDTFKAMHAYF